MNLPLSLLLVFTKKSSAILTSRDHISLSNHKMFKEIFLCLLGLILLFVLYRLTRSYKPKIVVNPEGNMAPIIAQMKMATTPYKPTPWLIGPHVHTIWGMRYRGRTNIQPRRETVNFEDGGEVYVDWFETDSTPKNAPILYIVHTLGGGTREPCTNRMAIYGMKHGWRVLICTCRGCNGSRITSKRLYDGVRTDDLHTIIGYAKKQFPEARNSFLIGYSLGSMISVQYSNDFDDVDAIMCVSHPLETEKTCAILNQPLQKKLYMPVIMHALTHVVEKSTFYEGEQREKGIHAKDLFEFDDAITAKNLGLNSYKDYYNLLTLAPKVTKSKVPLLLFNSDDDPFTSKDFAPKDAFLHSTNGAYVSTPEGGHVSFCDGMDGKTSYIERFAVDFFETVAKNKKTE